MHTFGLLLKDLFPCAACIERSRDLLGQELAALVGESYERAYQNMVRVQQLTELEETIDYSLAFQLAQGAGLPKVTICCPVSAVLWPSCSPVCLCLHPWCLLCCLT